MLGDDICYDSGVIRNPKPSHIQIISGIFTAPAIVFDSGKIVAILLFSQAGKKFFFCKAYANMVIEQDQISGIMIIGSDAIARRKPNRHLMRINLIIVRRQGGHLRE
ncbi:MAG: hypothetical protein A2Y80_09825 [Deltaproteobacteria bacterium RBG_13_58_19]|nr:MAG: hypothetical protein A2Y80_09825 [Deltaproteobacteria bacterium RBG_13_58_19]